VAHLGLDHFDLVGFSLGARTAARSVIAGMAPRRLVLAGMGLEGLAGWNHRMAFFRKVIDRFGTSAMAIRNTCRSSSSRPAVSTAWPCASCWARWKIPPGALAAITMPTLVLCGDQDNDNGSADNLAAALPNARRATIPGTHMSCVTRPELGQELVSFLTTDA
jgi:pimeloyl-ACP methyl ester carboxylesterase